MTTSCTGCNRQIQKDRETYWEVFTPVYKVFCGINCYRKDEQQEEQKKQAVDNPK